MRIFQPTVTGSNTTTGSLHISGPVYFYTLETSSVFHVLTYNTSSGQVFFTASKEVGRRPGDPTQSIQFNVNGEFSGSANFTFNNNTVYLTGSSLTSGSITLTGSMFVSGAISASYGSNTVGFYGTASWAQNSLTASFITASNVWGPFGSSSVFSASYALTASFAATTSAAPSDTYIQYNKNGVLGAEEYFRYIYASHSFQHGYNTVALGDWSHAEGYNTIASGSYSTVVGQYNIALPSQSAFIIGDGYISCDTIIDSDVLKAATDSGQNTFTILNNVSPSSLLIGATFTVTSYGGDEVFTILTVTPSLGNYIITVTPNTIQKFSVGSHYTIAACAASRHNLLFASRSWFDVSASNVFLRGLPTSPEIQVLVYNTSSGQVYYTASNAVGGAPAPPTNSIQFNNNGAFGGSSNLTYDSVNQLFTASATDIYFQTLNDGDYFTIDATGARTVFEAAWINDNAYVALGDVDGNAGNTRIIIDDALNSINLVTSGGTASIQFLPTESQLHVVTYNSESGQLFYTASNTIGKSTPSLPFNSIQFNGDGAFSGSSNLTYLSGSSELYLTGSMLISGAISASYGPNTVGFYGTSSWAVRAITSSYPIDVTGSTLFSRGPIAGIPNIPLADNSIFFGNSAGGSATSASDSNFLGYQAGYFATNALQSNFIGRQAGGFAEQAYNSNFLGYRAGYNADSASYSNFLGYQAGYNADNAPQSNFLGYQAGYNANDASYSNFLGYKAGYQVDTTSYSNFLGYRAGNQAHSASFSNFIGFEAGLNSTNASHSNFIGTSVAGAHAHYSNFIGYNAGNSSCSYSNFIGYRTGILAELASHSIFIGYETGLQAYSASYCTLIGYKAGKDLAAGANTISSNNIIIGNNITLPAQSKDSINIGGIIFATGSNSDITSNPILTPAGGNVGINIYPPQYNLHVSGTVAFPNLTNQSQVNVVVIDTASGQLFYTSSFGGGTPAPNDTYIQYNSASNFGAEQYFRYIYTSHSFEQGKDVVAFGSYSHAEGNSTKTIGIASHTEGYYTTASGESSHAEGYFTVASGAYSHAEGGGADKAFTTAIGAYSHAEGHGTVASGVYSHAEGRASYAYGSGSHVEGENTTAYGTGSHAEGYGTRTFGDYSHASGYYTTTSGSYQTVIGQFNAESTSQSAFIIGDGDLGNGHNVLFVSKSWFEASASNVFFKGLSTLPQLNILVYNTSSGQIYYTASSAVGGGSTDFKKYSVNITGGSLSEVITHNLGTRDVHVSVYENGSPYETVYPDIQRTSINTITLLFNFIPTSGQYSVYIST